MFNVSFSWFLLLGMVPQLADVVGNLDGEECAAFNTKTAYVATVGLDARMFDDRLRLWTDVETYVYPNPQIQWQFNPFRADYRAGFEFSFSKSITFGGIHECDHPVITGGFESSDMLYMKMETQFYLKISGGDR